MMPPRLPPPSSSSYSHSVFMTNTHWPAPTPKNNHGPGTTPATRMTQPCTRILVIFIQHLSHSPRYSATTPRGVLLVGCSGVGRL